MQKHKRKTKKILLVRPHETLTSLERGFELGDNRILTKIKTGRTRVI